MCDPVTAVIEGAKAIGSWLGANSGAIKTAAAVGQTYSAVKGAETAEKAQKAQDDSLKDQQERDAKAIAEQQRIELGKRKEMINKQRKQVVGETGYSINQTGDIGVTPMAGAGDTVLG